VTFAPAPLRIAFVSGVTLRKWTSTWAERHPRVPLEILPSEDGEILALLRESLVDIAFVRLPVDRDGLSVIRLYGEVATLIVPRDSPLADRPSITAAEVEKLEAVVPFPTSGSVKDAVALVGAGVGALRLPHSLARLHARKDVVALPIPDAPETEIALVWLAESTTDAIEEFVGIVRGRTATSSRSPGAAPADSSAPAVRPRPDRSSARSPGARGPKHTARNRKARGHR
jgi:DNA-binding transcriptional LysR family regulator